MTLSQAGQPLIKETSMEQVARRQVDQLLARYGESHLNPVNEVIHFICIPAIVFSLLGMVWGIHPAGAIAICVLGLIYYFSLSVPFAIGMFIFSAAMLWGLSVMPQDTVWQLSLGIFVLAWIGQFIGHKIEGKKPSFMEDLRFLMIGPLFVLGFLYRRLGIDY
jgi:uncharacterized membrane protein YGL010W